MALYRQLEGANRFFDRSLEPLCIAGTDGYLKRVNAAWLRMLGYEQEELLGRPYLDFVHPDDRDRTLAEAERLAAGATAVWFENRYRTKEGSYRWLAWNATPAGQGLIYASARDVTAERQAQEELARRPAAPSRAPAGAASTARIS
jgi:PAS domain S-box-containing protein